MSEAVERRLLEVLDHPTESPYGTPIPGLEELGETTTSEDFRFGVVPLDRVDMSNGANDGARPSDQRAGTEAAGDDVGFAPGRRDARPRGCGQRGARRSSGSVAVARLPSSTWPPRRTSS